MTILFISENIINYEWSLNLYLFHIVKTFRKLFFYFFCGELELSMLLLTVFCKKVTHNVTFYWFSEGMSTSRVQMYPAEEQNVAQSIRTLMKCQTI